MVFSWLEKILTGMESRYNVKSHVKKATTCRLIIQNTLDKKTGRRYADHRQPVALTTCDFKVREEKRGEWCSVHVGSASREVIRAVFCTLQVLPADLVRSHR